jgi:GMP synthase (glutamine-hydrolysing)
MLKALVLQHVAFEDLGTLRPELERAGFGIEVADACTADLSSIDPLQPDLLVVLGGPIGVYEAASYPFVDAELSLMRARADARRPTLGICLGAQLLAAALGARVHPGTQGKELGWSPIEPAADAAGHPWFASLLEPGLSVLHWHGDTFDLPAGARHLARTELYANQAFAVDRHALGLQFHPEVSAGGLERWYVGHACELAHAGVDVASLREASRASAPRLQQAAGHFWRAWLDHVFGAGGRFEAARR